MKTIFELEKDISKLFIDLEQDRLSLEESLISFEKLLQDYSVLNRTKNQKFALLINNFKNAIYKLQKIKKIDKNIEELEHILNSLYLKESF